jgi:hypothetical protein
MAASDEPKIVAQVLWGETGQEVVRVRRFKHGRWHHLLDLPMPKARWLMKIGEAIWEGIAIHEASMEHEDVQDLMQQEAEDAEE